MKYWTLVFAWQLVGLMHLNAQSNEGAGAGVTHNPSLVRAIDAIALGNPSGARKLLDSLSQQYPQDANVWYYIALTKYLESAGDNTGLANVLYAIELDPYNHKYHMLCGDYYSRFNEKYKGYESYYLALNLLNKKAGSETEEDKRDLRLLLHALGGSLLDAGYREKNTTVLNALLEKTTIYLEEAKRLDPLNPEIYITLGATYFRQKKYEKSIQMYSTCLALNENNQIAMQSLGIVYKVAGREYGELKNDLARAIEYLELARQYIQDDDELYRLLGVAYGIKGDSLVALGYFKQAVDLQPELGEHWKNLSITYDKLGKKKLAKRCMKRYEELKSKG